MFHRTRSTSQRDPDADIVHPMKENRIASLELRPMRIRHPFDNQDVAFLPGPAGKFSFATNDPSGYAYFGPRSDKKQHGQ